MNDKVWGKVEVEIKGLSPLLMHRCTVETLTKPSRGAKGKEAYDPEKLARESAYITEIDGKEQLYIPSEAIYGLILNAARSYHPKGKRYSMATVLAGAIRIDPEKIPLGHCKYEIDERVVRNKVTGARLPSARAKIPEWHVAFSIFYYRSSFTPLRLEQMHTILVDGGVRFGILSYRPQHRGPFGTFTVEKFNIVS